MDKTPEVSIHVGDCREIIATLPDCSIDSIVTDPPYELGFMGKKWDASGIAYDVTLWADCLRVLKPGGHLLAFGGTRTYHRMTVAIEDAGFEIRDSIHWLYGSGFPKSHDVSKGIDKAAGATREVVGTKRLGGNAAMSTKEKGGTYASGTNSVGVAAIDVPITAPATDAARQWEGWGTALKPAHEPIVMARKPLDGTVAANVLEHGTGALNIDGARVSSPDTVGKVWTRGGNQTGSSLKTNTSGEHQYLPANPAGRWPANIVITHAADCGDSCAADCPVAELDRQSGNRPGGQYPARRGKAVATGFAGGQVTEGGARSMGDSGGASRFFTVTEWDDITPFLYVAKPSRSERNAGLDELPAKRDSDRMKDDGIGGDNPRNRSNTAKTNHHPTVKPLALMRHLVRLVTPPGGTVLEPFAGSGTTLAAAILEGFDAIGCELTDDYLPIIEGRIAWAQQQTKPDPNSLFQ